MKVTKRVDELYVNCSLQLRHLDSPYSAASDNCNYPATSVVRRADGAWMYRCPRHEGLLSVGGVEGDVRYTVEVLVEEQ